MSGSSFSIKSLQLALKPQITHGEVEIPAGTSSAKIDLSSEFPGGIAGALFTDLGSRTLPYSYTLPTATTIEVHAPPYVIVDGNIVKREFTARAQWLAVAKQG